MKNGGSMYKSYVSFIEKVSHAINEMNDYCEKLPVILANICIFKELFPKCKFSDFIPELSYIMGVAPERINDLFSKVSKEIIENFLSSVKSWGITLDNFNELSSFIYEKYINKKESGAYYTDRLTTSFITLNCILEYVFRGVISINKFTKTCFNEKSGYSFFMKEYEKLQYSQKRLVKQRLANITILDPTCGTGAFLVEAIEILLKLHLCVDKKFNKASVVKHIIHNNIYGVDIDESAIAILKFRFYVIFKKYKIDVGAGFINIKIGNSLLTSAFNWVSNFDKVFAKGGFDCIVGNPPYVEISSMRNNYLPLNEFSTLGCGNLYSLVLEKTIKDMCSSNSVIGFIVPLSFVSTKRMKPIRDLYVSKCSNIKVMNFADRPSCLFVGVHQKLTILFARVGMGTDAVYTSKYMHWVKDNFSTLYDNITFVHIRVNEWGDVFPKVESVMERNILKKLLKNGDKSLIDNVAIEGKYHVWLNMRMCFWVKSFTYNQTSNEYKVFSFKNPADAALFSAIVNSSLFFFVWEAVSDCWHITLKDLNWIKIDFDKISSREKREIQKAYMDFETKLENNKKFIGSKQVDFIYQHKYLKVEIDLLDDLIAPLFNLTPSELSFVKAYQESHRINSLNQ